MSSDEPGRARLYSETDEEARKSEMTIPDIVHQTLMADGQTYDRPEEQPEPSVRVV
ncbi:hypothetical protein [Methylobacterium fujisawaense]|jgi:hypothetical protein|uniref:hypothetical protein n=1 Tax=Methylobacterium fujisawaense TaxID=107400 RepID=UPI0013E385C8